MFYAQLKNSIVIGVSQVSGAIESPDLIKISGLDTSLIGQIYQNSVFSAPTLPPPSKPNRCTRRQGRLALLDAGKLANVEALIEGIADAAQRTAARIEYEADAWERSNTALQGMWAGLGGTELELDNLFALAVTL